MIAFGLLAVNCWINAQPIFRTETISSRIQTLRVLKTNSWEQAPVIDLQKGEQIEISFDVLGAAPEYYTYRIFHCNADWTPSQIIESEYLTGLQNNPINDYVNSFNTKMDYVNYKLLIPNENTTLKLSGNYIVQIISGENNNVVLNACFSVVESQASIQMQISSITDKGANNKYQAVSFEVNYGNDIRIPAQDLKIYVRQNNRLDNKVLLSKPLNIQNRKAIYDHTPALIFDAGNEYRSFEMTTVHYAGMHIEAVEYHSPYFHSILKPDYVRSARAYLFYDDLNGRIFIHNKDAENSDIEADYQFVHFYIPCEKPFSEKIYILSDAFHNILDARSQMEYSEKEKGYVKSVLLKEGYYNYLYVNKADDLSPASTSLVEGNYYQTENEYQVWVYARTTGMRYDKLIGFQTLQFK
jgi:hypothetical protein